MKAQEGVCLCGEIRFAIGAPPARVTVCHCRYCQKATGSAYMVEPIFNAADLHVIKGSPAVHSQRSEGSGKAVHAHFCAACGTRLWLSFERFPEAVGVYAGVFDDPCWFEIAPEASKHIFTGVARSDTVLPPGVPVFSEHATTNTGEPCAAVVYESFHQIGRKGA
ncbi:GFA family protein [Pseudoruegeria sp. SHC-113]|uniref:GFA family protein n=1 Tax=Pseudoruegeria sp. SHC-113 TaxID=2855439 RepID=UPI0021BAB235|nr:GFA family protein [Pseudoruegeria sp. SHC-113]MCT8160374.1 GFA family protein [Pseudoruegeria sp. SHC-113]